VSKTVGDDQIRRKKREERYIGAIFRVCLDHFAFCIFEKESSIFEVLNVD